jgi:hypothetical protein
MDECDRVVEGSKVDGLVSLDTSIERCPSLD